MKWISVLERHAQRHQDLRALGAVYLSKGIIMSRAGDGKGAIVQFERALELFEKSGDSTLITAGYVGLGQAVLALGDLQTAEVKAGIYKAQRSLLIGTIHLSHGAFEDATRVFRLAAQDCGEALIPCKAYALLALGRALSIQGRRREALQHLQEATTLAPQIRAALLELEKPVFVGALSALEEAYGDPTAFRSFCLDLRQENPDIEKSGFVFWMLQRARPQEFPRRLIRQRFADLSALDWSWQDPFGDCTFTTQIGLDVHAANGRNLWHVNLSAPRLLRPAPQNRSWAVETTCAPARADRPSIGGLLLWKDKENYLRLDRGTRGNREISFQGCLANQDVILGRGRLAVGDEEPVLLRLERTDDRVDALCSADGEQWFSVGHVEFPAEGPLQVGLHAIGMIDRTIYHGAYPDGTAIRFKSFTLWGPER